MPGERWDLTTLYSGFDARFEADLAAATALADRLLAEADAGKLDAEGLFDAVNALAEASNPATYLELVLMTDAENPGALAHSEAAARLRQAAARLQSALVRAVAAEAPAADSRAGTPPPAAGFWAEQRPYLSDCQTAAAHLLPPAMEPTVRAMQQNGSRAWQALRNQLDAAAGADFAPPGGEARFTGLAALRGFASHPDAAVRKAAFEAEQSCYPAYAQPMAACLNGVKGEGLQMAEWRGFGSVLDQMLHENRMDRPTLTAMMDAVKNHLPMFHAYLHKKAGLLGHPGGLPYYDLLAPVDGARGYTFAEAKDLLQTVFDGFAPELGGLFRRAFAEGWVDAEPRPGKLGGALCADLPTKGQSRVLMNFTGNFGSVRTLAHELGHAFHGMQLRQVPHAFRDAPTPICEAAAIFNETVLQRAVTANGAAPALAEAGLAESTQTIVDIYSRYLFEDAVFETRKSRPLSAAELCGLMDQAQRTAYGDALTTAHPYRWMCKPHYYIPDFHYYNFPYIFGLLFAKGVYARYQADPACFMPRYQSYLAQSCAGSVHDIALRLGCDIHDSAFWDEAFAVLAAEFEQF